MGTINSQRQGGLTASADNSANQYKFIKITGNRTASVATVAGEVCIGVLGNKPVLGAAVEDLVGPEVKVRLGATLTANAKIATAADGRAQAAVTGNNILGYLVEGGVADDIVAMIFEPGAIAP